MQNILPRMHGRFYECQLQEGINMMKQAMLYVESPGDLFAERENPAWMDNSMNTD